MGYIRWLGHAAFELYLDDYRVLIDPWLTNPLSPVTVDDYKDNVDLIIVTHDHSDHTGETIQLLKQNRTARLVAVYELANHLAARAAAQDRVIGANIGGPFEIPGTSLRVALTPALHSSSIGTPTGAILFSKEAIVYHAGDTGLFAEMKLIGELYDIKVALLPIGGHFTMDIVQATKAVEMLRPDIVIPMHYNTFPLIKADANEFKRLVEEEKKLPTKVVVLKPGEKYEL